MIWLAWLSIAGVFALLSDSGPRRALLVICAGLVSVWVAKLTLHEAPFWLFSAIIWIAIGVYVSTLGSGYFIWAGLLLVLAGVMVMPGRLSGGDYAFGNPWLGVSDILGVAAIIVLAWPAVAALVDGSDDVGRRGGIHGPSDSVSDRSSGSQE